MVRIAVFDWEVVGKNAFLGRVVADVSALKLSTAIPYNIYVAVCKEH